MLIVRCPRCKKDMKYQEKTSILCSKRKRCVYCGHSFKIKDNIIQKTG
ncbi:hypothetical protein GF345_03855 [Candidatus Woesearchaeota archaeon]|nr:hypothetical protein [Candidatus Woesearchaeota archaeon]